MEKRRFIVLIRYLGALMLLSAILMLSFKTEVKAAALSNTNTQSFWFAVPDGGHSSAKVQITHTERYSSSGSNNTFNERNYSYVYTRAGATVTPQIIVPYPRHYNSSNNVIAEFASWYQNGVIIDPNVWDGGNAFTNWDSKTYSKTTGNTAKATYMVRCVDGYPSPGTGGVTVALKTQ